MSSPPSNQIQAYIRLNVSRRDDGIVKKRLNITSFLIDAAALESSGQQGGGVHSASASLPPIFLDDVFLLLDSMCGNESLRAALGQSHRDQPFQGFFSAAGL
jgi:hypothetical protein